MPQKTSMHDRMGRNQVHIFFQEDGAYSSSSTYIFPRQDAKSIATQYVFLDTSLFLITNIARICRFQGQQELILLVLPSLVAPRLWVAPTRPMQLAAALVLAYCLPSWFNFAPPSSPRSLLSTFFAPSSGLNFAPTLLDALVGRTRTRRPSCSSPPSSRRPPKASSWPGMSPAWPPRPKMLR